MTKLEKAEKIEEMRNTISDQVDLLTEFFTHLSTEIVMCLIRIL